MGKTAAAAVAVATALLFGLVFTANPAAAHHPELTASAECSYGDIRVDYDAFPWSSQTGTDPWRFAIARANLPGAPTFGSPAAQAVGWVTVEYTPATGGTTVLADASSPSGNREHYFQGAGDVEEGSFVVPDDPALFPLTVHVEDHGRWKNNANAAGTTTHPNATTTVQYPGECQSPEANPAASSSWECGEENIVVVLTNDGGGQDAFISVNGTEYVVEPDGSEEVLIAGPAEDETVQVTITVGGQNLVDPVTYDGNCQNPAASVSWECGSALEATLTNSGALGSVTFLVNGTEHVVGPDGSKIVPLGTPAEGDAIDVTVTAPGMDPVTFSEDEVDCQNPAASVSWECGSAVEATLTNTGADSPVAFDIDGTGHVVAPDEIKVVNLGTPAEGDLIDVTVTAPGMTPVTYTDGPVDCQNPAASVDWECGSDLTVTLTNTGGAIDVTFLVNGTEEVVGPDGSRVVNLGTPAEGDAIDVAVTAPGMADVTFSEDAVDCENPAASVAWECGSAVEATLTNLGGELPVTFLVNGDEQVVGPDGTEVVDLGTPAEGDTIEVTVTAPGMEDVTYSEGPVDCQNPAASVAWECEAPVEVTLTNAGGEIPVTFLVNGDEQVVGPDGTEVVDLGMPAEGDTIEVLVSAPGMEPVTYTEGPVDCEGVLCDAGETGVDGDGDEDADSCEPIVCDEGETAVAGDDDTNGVADTCEPVVCDEGETAVAGDDDTNGVADTCEPVVCDEGETAVAGDDDTNGVADTCEKEGPEVLPDTVTPAAKPTQTGALAFTGASTMTLAVGAMMLLLLGVGLTLAGKEFGD